MSLIGFWSAALTATWTVWFTGLNYWIMLAAVSPALISKHTEGVAPFVIGSPFSIAFSLEGFGYSLMGLSMLFAGPVFSGGKLERWVRWLLILNGVQVIAVIAGLLGVWMITMVSLAIWCISLPVVAILLAILFKRQSAAQQSLEATTAIGTG